MPRKEILRIRNRIHITVISYFYLQLVSKCVSQKILALKMVKLDCIIIYIELDTIQKARNELDGVCGLPLVISYFNIFQIILDVNFAYLTMI